MQGQLMSQDEENLKKSFDAREKHADNIIWRRLKEKAKELRFGTYEVTIKVHGGQIRTAEIYDVREKISVV